MRAPDFWYDKGSPLGTILSPLGGLYGFGGWIRGVTTRMHDCGVPVICVGNLTAGGAGKTPVTISLARRLRDRGLDAHVVSRGYGGRHRGPLLVDALKSAAQEVGDEPLLISRVAPTWVSLERPAGAFEAVSAGAEVILLDDGLQNPSLKKTLSLVVIDGETGIGNGHMLPAGPLREPLSRALARVDAAVVMGEDRAGVGAILPNGLTKLGANLEPKDGTIDRWRGADVLAFAGIGRPQKFFDTMESLGARVIETRGFPDHHPYSEADIDALSHRAISLRAQLVTTEKDAVRLPVSRRVDIAVVAVEVVWRDPEALEILLDNAAGHG